MGVEEFFSNEFFAQLISTLIGAFAAFLFGFKLYANQKRHENIGNLQYAISSLSALLINLYTFKKQVITERKQSLFDLQSKIQEARQNNIAPKILIKKLADYNYGANFSFPFSIEKFEFLTKREANLISFLSMTEYYLNMLSEIAQDMNEDHKFFKTKSDDKINEGDFNMLREKNILLLEQVDISLYFVEKTINLLLKFGELEFPQDINIKTVKISDQFKQYSPPIIESWENLSWFENQVQSPPAFFKF